METENYSIAAGTLAGLALGAATSPETDKQMIARGAIFDSYLYLRSDDHGAYAAAAFIPAYLVSSKASDRLGIPPVYDIARSKAIGGIKNQYSNFKQGLSNSVEIEKIDDNLEENEADDTDIEQVKQELEGNTDMKNIEK